MAQSIGRPVRGGAKPRKPASPAQIRKVAGLPANPANLPGKLGKPKPAGGTGKGRLPGGGKGPFQPRTAKRTTKGGGR